MKEIVFSRRTSMLLMAAALALSAAGVIAATLLGSPLDPLSLNNKALVAGLVGLVPGAVLGMLGEAGNACPACKKPMRYVLEDGGRVGLRVPFLDVFVRTCRDCGHSRD